MNIGTNAPFVQGNAKPTLADVHCSKIQFQPGDRILVEVNHRLSFEQKKQLRRTIQKWAGEPLQILIVDRTKMKVTIEKCQNLSMQG